MREAQEPTHLQRLPTPVLGQFSVLLWVLATKIRGNTTFTAGTTLNALGSAMGLDSADASPADFGNYLLSDEPPRDGGDGYLGFVFTKPSSATSTDLEHQTPVYERTIWQDREWPDVLRFLLGVTGTALAETEAGLNATQGATSNSRTQVLALDQFDLVPGGVFPTEIVVRKYVTPAPITNIFLEKPHATPVRYNYLNMSASLLALHGNIWVPPLLTGTTPIAEFGSESPPDLSRGQLFPETNFRTWRPYYFKAETTVEPKNGVYETLLYEALPPPMPPAQEL